jgi:uncharacterized protein YqeY
VTEPALVDRLRADLRDAMKRRDKASASTLRSVLASIANAEAVTGEPAPLGGGRIARAVDGLGAGDVARRKLSAHEVEEIVEDEAAERDAAAAQYDEVGQEAAAVDLRRQAALLRSYLRPSPGVSLYQGWDAPRPGWVCAECGLDYDATSPVAVVSLLEPLVPEYQTLLDADVEWLRERPEPSTWSALEYACHVRDCLALYDWRIRKVLAEERPEFPPMRRDAVVIEHAYNEQEPSAVARDMAANYERLADLLRQINGAGWERVGVREGEELSVAWMAINTLHECRHHVMDAERALVSAGG